MARRDVPTCGLDERIGEVRARVEAAGWDAVLDKDIDGDRAETTELENKEPRFGAVNAARRVARTLFLGSAPASVATKPGIRGLDRARVLLGCLQPGQTSLTYSDALNRLADRLVRMKIQVMLQFASGGGRGIERGAQSPRRAQANVPHRIVE